MFLLAECGTWIITWRLLRGLELHGIMFAGVSFLLVGGLSIEMLAQVGDNYFWNNSLAFSGLFQRSRNNTVIHKSLTEG